MMIVSATTLLVLVTGLLLIALFLWMYIRISQHDTRMTNTVNQLLLPVLSILVVAFNLLYSGHKNISTCTVAFNWTFYIGIAIAVLFMLSGFVRFVLRGADRNRSLITRPVLLAAAILTLTILIEYLGGCLYL
ncbi:MAG TPA: hypothetical protein VL461_01160 [Dictyobacter sp.]|jgi:hypothetical protein|nr:hypothetical protein [Dictyobacter sp.]